MSEEFRSKAEAGGTPAHAEQKNKAAPAYVDWGERFHGADSSILGTTVLKACCQCGIELNQRKRFKDTQGRYWCPDCNAADHIRHQPAPCEDCRTAFPRDQMKEDHGKFICEECLGKRLLGSVEPAAPETPYAAPAAIVSPPQARSSFSTPVLAAALVVLALALLAAVWFLR